MSYLKHYARLPVFFPVMEDKWEILKMYYLCKICFIIGKYKYYLAFPYLLLELHILVAYDVIF